MQIKRRRIPGVTRRPLLWEAVQRSRGPERQRGGWLPRARSVPAPGGSPHRLREHGNDRTGRVGATADGTAARARLGLPVRRTRQGDPGGARRRRAARRRRVGAVVQPARHRCRRRNGRQRAAGDALRRVLRGFRQPLPVARNRAHALRARFPPRRPRRRPPVDLSLRPSTRSEVKQHINSERSTIPQRRFGELLNCGLRIGDARQHIRFDECSIGVVVGLMSFLLQGAERRREVLNLDREPCDDLRPTAAPLCRPMLQGAIGLAPCRTATVRAGAPDKQIGARSRHAMKQRVVRSADGSPQVRLPRPATWVRINQIARGRDVVSRLQWILRGGGAAISATCSSTRCS